MHPTLYPVEKTLFEGADTSPDAPLVVDVAGGLGHDINEFKKFYPNHPGVGNPASDPRELLGISSPSLTTPA